MSYKGSLGTVRGESFYRDKGHFARLGQVEDGDFEAKEGKRQRLYWNRANDKYVLLTSYQHNYPSKRRKELQKKVVGGAYASVSEKADLSKEDALAWIEKNLEGEEKAEVLELVEDDCRTLEDAYKRFQK